MKLPQNVYPAEVFQYQFHRKHFRSFPCRFSKPPSQSCLKCLYLTIPHLVKYSPVQQFPAFKHKNFGGIGRVSKSCFVWVFNHFFFSLAFLALGGFWLSSIAVGFSSMASNGFFFYKFLQIRIILMVPSEEQYQLPGGFSTSSALYW